jgi:hypothetical protein
VEGVRIESPGTYACLFRRGTTLALAPRLHKRPLHTLSHITLAGSIVAFVDFQHGIDTGCYVIEVIDMANGRMVLFVPNIGCSGVFRRERVTDLVVNEHGSVSWIVARGHFHAPLERPESIEVHRATTSGSTAVLDSGMGIVPGSLRLAPGGEVGWLDAGRPLYATLP